MNEDVVNSPSHYTQGAVECIDAIEAAMSAEAFKGYLKGNIMKYLWRYQHKNGMQDLAKAQWYMNRLNEMEIVDEEIRQEETYCNGAIPGCGCIAVSLAEAEEVPKEIREILEAIQKAF